jgi:hypothetical protein
MAFQPTLSKFGVPVAPGQSGLGILMPKLKYRFRVTMQNFGPTGNAVDLTRNVMSAGRPQIQHNSTQIHSYNNIMYIPHKPEWQSITITVRDDINNGVSTLIGSQLQKQMNHFDQTSELAGINFKFTTILETLDGGNNGVLENWYLEGCYLETVNYEQFSYDSSDPMTIEMTVRYDNATQDGGTTGAEIMPQTIAPTGQGSTVG